MGLVGMLLYFNGLIPNYKINNPHRVCIIEISATPSLLGNIVLSLQLGKKDTSFPSIFMIHLKCMVHLCQYSTKF